VSGSLVEDFRKLVVVRFEQLRLHISESEAVENLILLVICRWQYEFVVGEQDIKRADPLALLEVLVKSVVENSRYSNFEDYFVRVWEKIHVLTDSRSRGGLIIVELWGELISYPFDNREGEGTIGECFEWLLSFFAEENMGRGGYFFTPSGIVSLMIKVLDPKSGEGIYDPSCGSGEFLVEAINHVRRASPGGELFMLGREMSPSVAFVAQANLFVHGVGESRIEIERYLSGRNYNAEVSGRFDLAIANPPFSLKNWDKGESNEFLRYGVPPQASADFAFVQNLLFSLNEKGRAAIIVPMGVLSRGGSEKLIRERMLRSGNVEAVISIPSMSFYGTAIPANILFLRRECSCDNVFFIDASSFFVKSQRLNRLDHNGVELLSSLLFCREALEGVASLISLEDIEANDWDLTVSKYIVPVPSVLSESLECLLARQAQLEDKQLSLQQKMKDLLSNLKN
jgi:type I restriction enzyme M protein